MPDHYRRFFRTLIRFALVMFVVGGVSGLVFQELTKKLNFELLTPGMRLEARYHLALLHGHAFLIGAILPLTWVSALNLSLAMGAKPIAEKTLLWIQRTFIVGTTGVLALIAYKGLHFVMNVRAGELDFAAIDASLFGGSKALRAISYGSIHTLSTVSIFLFAWQVWRCLGPDSKRHDHA